MSADEKYSERHDAIHVMARGMEAMAKHNERMALENEDLKKRIAELTELAVLPPISPAPPEVNATNENPDPFVP